MNRRDEAAKVIEPLPRSDTQAEAMRAGLALDRSDLGEARAILDAGPADDPRLAPLRRPAGASRRDVATAVEQFRIAVAAQPGHRDSLSGLGRALRMAGDAKAAEPYLKAAADLDALELLMQNLISPGAPTDPKLLHKLGAACEALRRFPEARCWYRLALGYDPDADRTRRRSRPSSMPRHRRPRHPEDGGAAAGLLAEPCSHRRSAIERRRLESGMPPTRSVGEVDVDRIGLPRPPR